MATFTNVFTSVPTDPGLAVKPNPCSFTETRASEHREAVRAEHGTIGLILKVEHPPVLGSDGFCTSTEESIVYSAPLDGGQLDAPSRRALAQGKELQNQL